MALDKASWGKSKEETGFKDKLSFIISLVFWSRISQKQSNWIGITESKVKIRNEIRNEHNEIRNSTLNEVRNWQEILKDVY